MSAGLAAILFACAADATSSAPQPEAGAAVPDADADAPVAVPLPADLPHRLAEHVGTFGRNWPSFRFHGAILVARGDDLAMLSGFGHARLTDRVPNTPHTRFRIGTLGAPITAATVLVLADRGELSLSDPVVKHLPDFPDGDAITIEHLLGHRSGIGSFTDSIMFRVWKREGHTIDETMALVSAVPREGVPGGAIMPSNSNSLVLGAIVERVTGESFDVAAKRLVLLPAGMLATTYGDGAVAPAVGMQWNRDEAIDMVDHVDPTAFGSAGGFVSTVEDLHRFMRTISAGALLSEDARSRLYGRTPEDPGFGFVPDIRFGRRVLRWPGVIDGFNGALEHYPADATTIVVLANSEVVPTTVIADAAAILAYGGEPQEWLEPRAAPVAFDQQRAAAGDYVITRRSLAELERWADPQQIERMLQVRVAHEADHLVLDVPGHGRRRMHPLSNHRFFFKDVRHTVAELSRTADGTRRLVLRQGDGPPIRFVSLPSIATRG